MKRFILFIIAFNLPCTSGLSQDINKLFSMAGENIANRQFEDAKIILTEVEDLAYQQNQAATQIFALCYKAYCDYELTNYLTMNQSAEKALAVFDEWESKGSFGVTNIHYMLGLSYYKLGNSPLALQYLNSCYVNNEKYKDLAFRKVDLLNSLALCYLDLSDYEKVRLYINLAIQSNNPDVTDADIANWNILIARTYQQQGDYPRAKTYFEMALTEVDAIKNKVYKSNILNRYMNFLIETNDLGNATLTKNRLEELKPAKSSYSNYKQNVANLYLAQNKHDKALQEFNIVIENSKNMFGEKHEDIIETYIDIGSSFYENQNFVDATRYFDLSLSSNTADTQDISNKKEELASNNFLVPKLALRSLLYKVKSLAKYDYEKSKEGSLALINLLTNMIEFDITMIDSKLFLVQTVRNYFKELIDLSFDQGDVSHAFTLCQKSHGLILDLQTNENAIKSTVLPDHYLERDKSYKKELTRLQTELFVSSLENANSNQTQLRKNILDLQSKYDSFQDSIMSEFPILKERFHSSISSPISSLKQHLLDDESLLIEYFLVDTILYSFALSRDTLAVYKDTVATDFNDMVTEYNNLTKAPANENFFAFTTVSNKLYDILFESIFSHEAFQKEILYIVPDGIINYISFDALVSEIPAGIGNNRYDLLEYMVETYEINYNYSSYLYQFENQIISFDFSGYAPTANQNDSIIDFLPNLNFNQDEVLNIQNIMNGSVFLDTTATIASFKESINTNNVAHLATHAICNDSIPMQSKIYFSDAILNVHEIYNIPNKLDLVVLSACRTGTGRYRKGEGIMSMARAFLASGCNSIITSLWNVNDKISVKLMTDFYQGISEGNSFGKSLRQAKLNYLDKPSSILDAHPYYWSGFVLVGDNASLKTKSSWHRYGLVLLMATLLLFFFFKLK